jgi:hypothetical protein
MSKGWSDADKKVVKTILGRAQKRAEREAIKEFHGLRVQSMQNIWNLELKIRGWRKDRYGVFYFRYDRVERQIADYLQRGWVLPDDLQSLSEERRARILNTEP